MKNNIFFTLLVILIILSVFLQNRHCFAYMSFSSVFISQDLWMVFYD